MYKWLIAADSSCDLNKTNFDCGDIGFESIPLTIRVGEKEFVDLPGTDPNDMFAAMKSHNGPTSSACPPPEAFAEQFRKAQYSFCVTITSNLSGTYNCAMQAKEMVLEEFPEKKIHIVDSLSTGGTMVLIIKKLRELIEQGLEFEEIVEKIDEYRDSTVILFSLATFDTLIKNGRMNPVVGLMASALNIHPVAYNPGGVIVVMEKPRGEKKAINRIATLMSKQFKYKVGTPIVITHCNNPNAAKTAADAIKQMYGISDSDITYTECACLTAYYAGDQSILVSFEGDGSIHK